MGTYWKVQGSWHKTTDDPDKAKSRACRHRMVAQGAFWPPARQKEEGYTAELACAFCGGQGCATAKHQFWECDAMYHKLDPELRASEELRAKAAQRFDQCLCFGPAVSFRGV